MMNHRRRRVARLTAAVGVGAIALVGFPTWAAADTPSVDNGSVGVADGPTIPADPGTNKNMIQNPTLPPDEAPTP